MLHQNETADQSEVISAPETTEVLTSQEEPEAKPEKAAGPLDKYEKLRRSREIIEAKVIKWANNGLEVELEGAVKASMPNNHIDLDPDRNIAKYFGKTVPVRIVNLRMEHGQPYISVSHRSVLEDDLKRSSKATLDTINVGDTIEA